MTTRIIIAILPVDNEIDQSSEIQSDDKIENIQDKAVESEEDKAVEIDKTDFKI